MRMVMKRNKHLNTFLVQCLFISLFSCTSNANNQKAASIKLDKENSELIQQWKQDSLGCENIRSKVLAEKIIINLKLENTPKDNFIKIFGTPNVVRNYEGKIILCYYFNSSCVDGSMLKDADTCLAEFTFKNGSLIQRNYICN